MTLKLRALLLAAGFGTRLRPLTINTPKCLVSINGKTLLTHWLDILKSIKCEQVLINTHYLSDKVEDFIYNLEYKDLEINTIYEPKLLGTAGTLLRNLDWFKDSTGILIHADNLTTSDLKILIESHRKRPKECLLTMLTFYTHNPKSCGVVETDNNGILTDFYEKVENPPTSQANAAVYVFDPEFVIWLREQDCEMTDFSCDVIPLLKGRIQTCPVDAPYLDIGTPEALLEAENLFKFKI